MDDFASREYKSWLRQFATLNVRIRDLPNISNARAVRQDRQRNLWPLAFIHPKAWKA